MQAFLHLPDPASIQSKPVEVADNTCPAVEVPPAFILSRVIALSAIRAVVTLASVNPTLAVFRAIADA